MSGEPGVSDATNPDAALDSVFDTPSEPAPEPTEAPAEDGGTPESTAPDAKPRDEKGRFVKPSSPEESPAEPSEAAETPAEPGTDTEPQDTTAEADGDVDLSNLPEFSYKAVGQEQAFPGTFVSEAGEVLFTKDAIPALKQKLALADSFPGYRAQMQRDAAAQKNRADAAEQQVEAIFAKMEELAANPDAAWDWWSNVAGNWKLLQADAKTKAAELRAKELEERQSQVQYAQQEAEQIPQMRGLVEEMVRQYGPEAGLDKAGQDRVIRRLQAPEWLDRLFPRATQDDPQTGLRRGQRIGSLYQQQIAQELVWIRDLAGKREEKQAAKVSKPAKVPPTVAAGKGPAPKPSPKIPAFKSAKEADEYWFDNDGFKNAGQ